MDYIQDLHFLLRFMTFRTGLFLTKQGAPFLLSQPIGKEPLLPLALLYMFA